MSWLPWVDFNNLIHFIVLSNSSFVNLAPLISTGGLWRLCLFFALSHYYFFFTQWLYLFLFMFIKEHIFQNSVVAKHAKFFNQAHYLIVIRGLEVKIQSCFNLDARSCTNLNRMIRGMNFDSFTILLINGLIWVYLKWVQF